MKSIHALQFDILAALRILLIIALPLAGPSGYLAAYGLLILWCIRGSVEAVEALCMAAVINNFNPGIAEPSDSVSVLRWLLLLSAFGTAAIRQINQPQPLSPVLKTASGFTAVGILLTFVASYAIDVSLFKLVIFLIGCAAVILHMDFAARHSERDVIRWMITFCSMVILVSFPLITNSVGYETNNHGFQGIFNQPQVYGVFLAPFTAWLLVRIYTGRTRHVFWWLVAGVAIVSLIATEARTGIFALLIGLMFSSLASRLSRGTQIIKTIILAWLIFAGSIIAFGYVGDSTITAITEIVTKRDKVSSFTSAYEASRGRLTDASLSNFAEHPFAGIGFGLPSDQFTLEVTRVFGIPVNAPAEKGVIVFSVLEEVGLIGFAAFLLLVSVCAIRPLLWRAGPALAVVMTALATNAGEATFFSFGGIGLMVWIWIAYGTAAALHAPVEPTGRLEELGILAGHRFRRD